MIFYRIEIQNGSEITDRIVLNTMERAMNSLFNPYISANAKGVMATGMAASVIDDENWFGECPVNFIAK